VLSIELPARLQRALWFTASPSGGTNPDRHQVAARVAAESCRCEPSRVPE
jgi:hypothetical protein